MKVEREFLSKRQVAEMLNLSIFTIDSWVSQRREIPFIKMGRNVRFDIRDVRAWLEKRKFNPE